MNSADDASVNNRNAGTIQPSPPSWQMWPAAGSWWQQLSAAPRSVLMLDYDGTLAPFARDRMRAAMYPGVAERLLQMAQFEHLRVVLVSGRQAKEVLSLLPPGLHPEIWGSHGREELLPNAEYNVRPLAPEQVLALAFLEDGLIASGLTERIERKPGSLAVHTRGLPLKQQFSDHEIVRLLFPQIEKAGFSLLPFDGGLEVRASGCSKANAVEHILKKEEAGVVAAYLGDDLTDEDAFAALSERGLRVLVRGEPRETLADVWLRPPGELLEFFDRWQSCILEPRMNPS